MSNQETITLKNAVAAYLEYLEKNGTKATTIGVYRRALDMSIAHFGEEKKLTAIMVPHVSRFFDSNAINFHESGRPKAKPTIIQTKRVFRQCMQFAKDCGWLAILPVPKNEMQHARSKKQVSSQRESYAGEREIPPVGKPESSDQEAKIDS